MCPVAFVHLQQFGKSLTFPHDYSGPVANKTDPKITKNSLYK